MSDWDDLLDRKPGAAEAMLLPRLRELAVMSEERLAELKAGKVALDKTACRRELRMLRRALADNLDGRDNASRRRGKWTDGDVDAMETLYVRLERLIREQITEVERLSVNAPEEAPWTVQFDGPYAMPEVEKGLDMFLAYDAEMEAALRGAEGNPLPLLSEMDLDTLEDGYEDRQKGYALIAEQLRRWRAEPLVAAQVFQLEHLEDKLQTLRDNAARMMPLVSQTRSFTQEGVVGLMKTGGMEALAAYVLGAAKKKS